MHDNKDNDEIMTFNNSIWCNNTQRHCMLCYVWVRQSTTKNKRERERRRQSIVVGTSFILSLLHFVMLTRVPWRRDSQCNKNILGYVRRASCLLLSHRAASSPTPASMPRQVQFAPEATMPAIPCLEAHEQLAVCGLRQCQAVCKYIASQHTQFRVLLRLPWCLLKTQQSYLWEEQQNQADCYLEPYFNINILRHPTLPLPLRHWYPQRYLLLLCCHSKTCTIQSFHIEC